MKTNIKRDWLDKFQSADITGLDVNEYTSIMLYLRRSLERIEQDIDECKAKEHLNKFIEGREIEHRQLKQLIEKLEG